MTRSYIDLSPTPEEWQRARELQEDYNSVSKEEARRIADSLIEDCRASGYVDASGKADYHNFLVNTAKDNPVRPDPTGKPFAFWSFESREHPSSEMVGHRHLAQACAESRGFNVLETTEAGQRLDAYRLFDPEVRKALKREHKIDESDLKPARKEAWKNLSRSYTEAARGDSFVFAAEVSSDSVLGRDELPELRSNSSVGVDRVKFALPMPGQDHLPGDVRSFIEHDEVRSSLVMQDYWDKAPDPDALRVEGLASATPAPHYLAHRLEQVELPVELHAQRDEAAGRLRSVNSFSELSDPGVVPGAEQGGSGRGEEGVVSGKGGAGVGAGSVSGTHKPGLPPVPKGVPSVAGLPHSGVSSVDGSGAHNPRSRSGVANQADRGAQGSVARPTTGRHVRPGIPRERGD